MRNAPATRIASKRASCIWVAVDVLTQLGAAVANILGVDEHSRDAGRDHRGLEHPDTGHVKIVDQVAGGEHRTTLLAIVGRIEELQHDLGGRKGHPIQLEVTGFLHLAIADRHMGDDGFMDIGLPDTHHADAVLRDTRRVNQPGMNGKSPGASRQVAAVATPIDKGLVDRHLTVEVVDIVIRPAAFRKNHALAGRWM